MMELKVFSFFSGSGFLDLGFESNGFDIVFVNEVFPPFIDAHIHTREKLKLPAPELGHHGNDITTHLNGNGVILKSGINTYVRDNNVVGFIGGPPCPDFSVGGKNRGFKGENGILTKTYFKLIQEHKPDFFLFENVKGLWRTQKHRIFYEKIKKDVIKAGYTLTERLINSIEYGAPQDRERIILIGFKNTFLSDFGVSYDNNIIPEEEFNWNGFMSYKKDEVFSYAWPQESPFIANSELHVPDNIPEELTVQHWFKENDVDHHENAAHVFKPRQGLRRFLEVNEGDDSRKSYKRLHRWRYSPTVCYGNNEVHLHPYKARRLTVAEALSLQSLPKNFTLPPEMSLTNMFKTVGNGVPYLASSGLAKTIKGFIERLT